MDPIAPLQYDIDVIEIPITLKGKKGVKEYVLCEASEPAAARYQNAQLKATKMTENADGSRVGVVDGLSDTEALLVSLCLFEVTDNGGRKSVDLIFVKNLPHRVCKDLFEKAEHISGLEAKQTPEQIRKKIKILQEKLSKLEEGKTQENELKNLQSATEITSD